AGPRAAFMKRLVLGTRGSDLALAQTRLIAAQLRTATPALEIEQKIIRTTGDERLDVSLSAPGSLDKGLFTKELEEALLRGEIDAAVHSLKDLPVDQPAGLIIGAIPKREDPGDVLVSKADGGLDALPHGAAVATSSLRRKCFLLAHRPDLAIHDIRGNVPTRIRKLAESSTLAALVLATAGLRRLKAADVALALEGLHVSPLEFILPAPGQGAIAIECRANDEATLTALAAIHDEATSDCVRAERAVLAGLGGGCHMPLGALANFTEGSLFLRAVWFPDAAANLRTAEHRGAWREAAAAVVTQLTA
ncbi:MAG: hydroxymethylbilane synthase, partial [Chthoniobacterales bacterium]